jgi:hypothetical protein
MNYFNYLLKNKLLWFLAFFALVAAFMYFTDPEPFEVKWISIGCGAMMAAFLVGNFIVWRKLK